MAASGFFGRQLFVHDACGSANQSVSEHLVRDFILSGSACILGQPRPLTGLYKIPAIKP
jgi:hypothetical protein